MKDSTRILFFQIFIYIILNSTKTHKLIGYYKTGDNMKKMIITSIFILIIGIVFGTKIYDVKDSLMTTLANQETYYFLQEGVYTSKKIMEENIKNLPTKAIEYKQNKYYVYIGITKEENIAKKIKSIYEEEGYQIYIKEIKIYNEEFNNNITQFDLLINSATTKDEILTIEEVVLANYEETTSKD